MSLAVQAQDDDLQQQQQQQSATENVTSTVVVLDSLPYIDAVNEDYEQYALALIEDEMKQHNTSAKRRKTISMTNDVAVVNLRTESMKEAYARVQSSAARTTATAATSAALLNAVAAPPENSKDAQAWRQAVNKARVAFELERLRSVQLDVDKEDGPASAAEIWKRYNGVVLEPQLAELQQQLILQQKTVEKINFCRQQDQQERCGRQLQVLRLQYEELVQKQFQLHHAIADIEVEMR